MRKIASWILLMCFMIPLAAWGEENTDESFLQFQEVQSSERKKISVYQGPGFEYGIAGKGKACVSTKAPFEIGVYEGFDMFVMVQYEISEGRKRIGWVNFRELPEDITSFVTNGQYAQWQWGRSVATEDIPVTDDPFGAKKTIIWLRKNTQMKVLAQNDEWAYIQLLDEEGPFRGFVPVNKLQKTEIPYWENPYLNGAPQLLQEAGIEAEITGMNDNQVTLNTLFFTLKNGGTAKYSDFAEYHPYYMNWKFEGVSDEDIGKFLDQFLRELVKVENEETDDKYLKEEYCRETGLGKRNKEAVVSSGLFFLEDEGEQWFRVLMSQLERHENDPDLNSMRARLASRMLGITDMTPVDPKEGLLWYDSLTLSVQDKLPPVDAGIYIQDENIRQLAQQLIDWYDSHEREFYKGYPWYEDYLKSRYLVTLDVAKQEEKNGRLTVWAWLGTNRYVLYDGYRGRNVSGMGAPCRIEAAKGENGLWKIDKLILAEDGDCYAPSIVRFCDGDKRLADRLMKTDGTDAWNCFEMYLKVNGYKETLEEIPYR